MESKYLDDKLIMDHIVQNKKQTLLLRPHKNNLISDPWISKFGGNNPLLNGFSEYPKCKYCGTPLNFTLQIFRNQFDDFYFPQGKELFQIFRCPNGDCPESFNEHHDLTTFYFYFSKYDIQDHKHYEKPKFTIDTYEDELNECLFKPSVAFDYKDWGNSIAQIGDKYGDDFLFDILFAEYFANSGTKINGIPAFIQGGQEIMCNCGKEKELFLQISSEDVEEGVEYPPHPDNWSGHGLMIGDLGYIYYFVCKDCGENSIESHWECS